MVERTEKRRPLHSHARSLSEKMGDPSPVQMGIEMAKKAIEYDNGHMYVQAIMCYDLALDYFKAALNGNLSLSFSALLLLFVPCVFSASCLSGGGAKYDTAIDVHLQKREIKTKESTKSKTKTKREIRKKIEREIYRTNTHGSETDLETHKRNNSHR